MITTGRNRVPVPISRGGYQWSVKKGTGTTTLRARRGPTEFVRRASPFFDYQHCGVVLVAKKSFSNWPRGQLEFLLSRRPMSAGIG